MNRLDHLVSRSRRQNRNVPPAALAPAQRSAHPREIGKLTSVERSQYLAFSFCGNDCRQSRRDILCRQLGKMTLEQPLIDPLLDGGIIQLRLNFVRDAVQLEAVAAGNGFEYVSHGDAQEFLLQIARNVFLKKRNPAIRIPSL